MLPNLAGLRLEQRDARDECEPTGPFAALSPREAQRRKDNNEVDPITLEYLEPNRHRGEEGATFRLPTHGRGGRSAQNRWNYYDAKALAEHVRTQLRTRQYARDPVLNTLIPPREARRLMDAYPVRDPQYEVDPVDPLQLHHSVPTFPWMRVAPTAPPPPPGERYHLLSPFQGPVHFEWQTTYRRGALGALNARLNPVASLVPERPQVQNCFTIEMPLTPHANFHEVLTEEHDVHRSLRRRVYSALLPPGLQNEGHAGGRYPLALLERAFRDAQGGPLLSGLDELVTSYLEPAGWHRVDPVTGEVEFHDEAQWRFAIDIDVRLVRLLVLHPIEKANGGPSTLDQLLAHLNAQLDQGVHYPLLPPRGALDPPPAQESGPGAGLLWNGRVRDDNAPDLPTWTRALAVLIESTQRLVARMAERPNDDDEMPMVMPAPGAETVAESDRAWATTGAARIALAYSQLEPPYAGITSDSYWDGPVMNSWTTGFHCYANVPVAYWALRDPYAREQ